MAKSVIQKLTEKAEKILSIGKQYMWLSAMSLAVGIVLSVNGPTLGGFPTVLGGMAIVLGIWSFFYAIHALVLHGVVLSRLEDEEAKEGEQREE